MRKACLLSLLLFASLGSFGQGSGNALAADKYSTQAESTTGVGGGGFFQSLSLGSYHANEEQRHLVWSVDYGMDKVPAENGHDLTQSAAASFGVQGVWDYGAEFSYSQTPRENLRSLGPGAWLGRNFNLGRGRASGDDDSQPSLELMLHVHQSFYREADSEADDGLEVLDVQQREYNLSLTWEPNDRWRFRLGQSVYSYGGDPGLLAGRLFSERILDSGIGSSFEILGGFMKEATSVGATFTPGSRWTFDLSAAHGTSLLEGDSSYDLQVGAQKQLTKRFSVGLDFSHQISKRDGDDNLVSTSFNFRF